MRGPDELRAEPGSQPRRRYRRDRFNAKSPVPCVTLVPHSAYRLGARSRRLPVGSHLPTHEAPRARQAHRGSAFERRESGYRVHMSDSLRLTITYEQGEDGWIIAAVPAVPGTFSQGRTREEARVNVIDALRLMLRPEPHGEDDVSTEDSEPLELTIAR